MLWGKQTAIPILMEISKALGYQRLVFLKYWCSSLKDECRGQICTFRESLKGGPCAQRIRSLTGHSRFRCGRRGGGRLCGKVTKRVLSEWTTWAARLLLTPPGALLLSRLGGTHRQPRQDLLRGPREQDHNVAAAHSAPRPAGAAEVQLHPADGAAEPQVRAAGCPRSALGLGSWLPGAR